MNLQLSLKKQWFEMTKLGIKTEDYREITPYWCARLFNKKYEYVSVAYWKGYLGRIIRDDNRQYYGYSFRNIEQANKKIADFGFNKFNTTTLTLGYPKANNKERILKLEHKGIEIRTGNPEWGAEPNKLYFVIKHGRNYDK